MDDSIELLTTMSPKCSIKPSSETKKRNKLALKKITNTSEKCNEAAVSEKKSSATSSSDCGSTHSSKSTQDILKPEEDCVIDISDLIIEATVIEESPLKKEQTIQRWVNDVNNVQGSLLNNAQGKLSNNGLKENNYNAINSTFLPETSAIAFEDWLIKKSEVSEPVHNSGSSNRILKDSNKVLDNAKKVEVKENNLIRNKKSDRQLKDCQLDDLKHPSESKTPTACLQDVENVLDSLYGNSWRKNRDQVLSTPRAKALQPQLHKLRAVKTEAKKQQSFFYKNPYLESERKKSQNLLESLHKARIRKNFESPFFARPEIVDDDSPYKSSDSDDISSDSDDISSDSDKPSLETKKGRKPLRKQDRKYKRLIFPNNDDDSKSDTSGSCEIIKSSDDDQDKGIKKNNRCKETASNLGENVNSKTKGKLIIKTDELGEKFESMTIKSKAKKGESFLASLSKTTPINICDPRALIFRDNFQKHRDALAKELFALYNEQVFDNCIPKDSPIIWNSRLRGTAGMCACIRKTDRDGVTSRNVKLQLSTKVLDSAERLRDTLIHEMCHAATFIVNEVSDGHGSFWQAWTRKALATFPELPPIRRCHNYDISYRYTYRCVECGYSFGRHSKSLDLDKKRCGHCHGKFEVLLNKTTKTGERKQTPCTPKQPAKGFALFVKENYANYKSPGENHKDVMKVLGQEYKEKNILN